MQFLHRAAPQPGGAARSPALSTIRRRFDPQVIAVSAESEVTWANEDDVPHNVHLLHGSDATHDLLIGDSVRLTFDEVGD